MHSHWNMLNEIVRDGKAVGGREPVQNWEMDELINEVAEKDVDDMTLDSKKEALEFTLGIGRYSENNSFNYNQRDVNEIQNEGFFNEPYCPQCVHQATEVDIDDDDIDPMLEPNVVSYTKKSFKHNSSKKEVTEVWYQCSDHPEFYLQKKEKEHI